MQTHYSGIKEGTPNLFLHEFPPPAFIVLQGSCKEITKSNSSDVRWKRYIRYIATLQQNNSVCIDKSSWTTMQY